MLSTNLFKFGYENLLNFTIYIKKFLNRNHTIVQFCTMVNLSQKSVTAKYYIDNDNNRQKDFTCLVRKCYLKIISLTLFWAGSGITLLGGGGPLWPGWILAILRLSVGILKPKHDFHQTFLIFGCPQTPKIALYEL